MSPGCKYSCWRSVTDERFILLKDKRFQSQCVDRNMISFSNANLLTTCHNSVIYGVNVCLLCFQLAFSNSSCGISWSKQNTFTVLTEALRLIENIDCVCLCGLGSVFVQQYLAKAVVCNDKYSSGGASLVWAPFSVSLQECISALQWFGCHFSLQWTFASMLILFFYILFFDSGCNQDTHILFDPVKGLYIPRCWSEKYIRWCRCTISFFWYRLILIYLLFSWALKMV